MSLKVLVVDDMASIREPLAFLLEEEGYEVETASNGVEALETIRRFRPVLVFLDIMMPLMNGFEVCRQVKADPELKGTYVIMLTAKGQQADLEQSLVSGADEYMPKPYSPSTVLTRLVEVFGRRA